MYLDLDGLRVALRGQRQTDSGKLVATVALVKEGKTLASDDWSSATSSKKLFARKLVTYATNGMVAVEAERVVDAVLDVAALKVDMQGQAAEHAQKSGPTIKQIVEAEVPKRWRLAYRTAKGAWSEARAEEVAMTTFTTLTPGWLITLCEQATDAPRRRNGDINRMPLRREIRSELEVLWANLTDPDVLPAESHATLEASSAAGKRFRRSIITVWTAPKTFTVSKTTLHVGDKVDAARASLASRAKHEFEDYTSFKSHHGVTRGWKRVQTAFDAWWRCDWHGDRPVFRIGMKDSLYFQLQIPVPNGIAHQEELTRLAKQFGCAEMDASVKNRLPGGRCLLVLSQELSQEIIEEPVDDDEVLEDEGRTGQASSSQYQSMDQTQ